MTSNYQSLALSYLRISGPCLSSELAEYLKKTTKCSIEAARQAVYRLKPPIHKLSGINFKDTQQFIYLSDEFGTEQFRRKLIQALLDQNTAAGRAIRAINARGGYIRKWEFPSLSGAPIRDLSGQLRSDKVESQLVSNNILKEERIEGDLYYRIFNAPFDVFISYVELKIADLLIAKCAEWAVRVGLSSESTFMVRSEDSVTPQFGLFGWDLTSSTYLQGLAPFRGNKKDPGFFAADVLIKQGLIKIEDLAAFKHKVEVIRSQRKFKRYIPALVHTGIDIDALMMLRGLGVMCLEPKSFGDPQIALVIKELLLFLKDAKQFFADPVRLNNLIDRMLTSEFGRYLNLPGILFTMMVALLYKSEGHFVDTGKQITTMSGNAEIDVFVITTSKQVVCIETKGYKKNKRLDLKEIEEWITEKRPRIVRWYERVQNDGEYKGMRFEFIISSKYTEDEMKHLTEFANRDFKKYPVTFLDSQHVLKLAKKHSQNEILRGFSEHF